MRQKKTPKHSTLTRKWSLQHSSHVKSSNTVVDNMDVTDVPLKQFKGKKKNIKMNNKMQRKKRTPDPENGGSVSAVEAVETKPVLTPLEPALPPTFSLSEIKNKQRRHQMFMKLKQDKRKVLLA